MRSTPTRLACSGALSCKRAHGVRWFLSVGSFLGSQLGSAAGIHGRPSCPAHRRPPAFRRRLRPRFGPKNAQSSRSRSSLKKPSARHPSRPILVVQRGESGERLAGGARAPRASPPASQTTKSPSAPTSHPACWELSLRPHRVRAPRRGACSRLGICPRCPTGVCSRLGICPRCPTWVWVCKPLLIVIAEPRPAYPCQVSLSSQAVRTSYGRDMPHQAVSESAIT